MENVVLTVHLILALLLVGVVLLQRSEGGGLGVGGGNSVMTGRGAATALAKVTWGLAAAFIATSLTLTWMAGVRANSGSVVDALTAPVTPPAEGTTAPAPGGNLLPELPSATTPAPAPEGNAAPATPAPAAPAPTSTN